MRREQRDEITYLHIFVRRGWRSNTDIWFQVQEAQNIDDYGDKRSERRNLSST